MPHETTGDSEPPPLPEFPTFPGVPVPRLTTVSFVSFSAPANLLPLPLHLRSARSFAYHRVAAPAVNQLHLLRDRCPKSAVYTVRATRDRYVI